MDSFLLNAYSGAFELYFASLIAPAPGQVYLANEIPNLRRTNLVK